MEDFSLLDEEEIMLLVSSGFSLLFTTSFIYSYIKVFRHKLLYTELPIIAISFNYLNNLVWYYYSDSIYHDYMILCFDYNLIISYILIALFLFYEWKEDKIDMFLNIGIFITASWAIKKLLVDILKDDDKIKITCSYSSITFLFTMIEWFYRAYKEKNKNILNIFSGLFLVCSSISWMVYGYQFEELSFLIPNVIGLVIAGIYIRIWFYLRKFENLESPQKDNDMENNINNENKDNLSNSNKTFDEQEKMVKNN
jgi:uncharacterized protein with PQ loop repeat